MKSSEKSSDASRATERSSLLGSYGEASIATLLDPRVSSAGPHSGGKASAASVIFNLSNTILGAGMLGLPAAFASWGVIMGTVGLVGAAMASAFGLQLLSECADAVGRPSGFYDVAEAAQPNLGIVIDFAVAIKCFGVACSYLTVVANSMVDVVGPSQGFVSTREFWVLMAAIAAVPPTFLRKMDKLRFTSIAALVCIAFIILLIVIFTTGALNPCSKPLAVSGASTCGSEIDVLPSHGAAPFLNKISTFVFAYTCHQNIFSLTNEMYDPRPARINGSIAVSCASAMLVYILVSYCGYLTFGNDVKSDILQSYPVTPIVTVARIAISIVVIFSYPLQAHPSRLSIMSIVNFCGERCCPSCCGGSTDDEERSAKLSTGTPALEENTAHAAVTCKFGPTFGGSVSPDTSMHYLITTVYISLSFLVAITVTDLGLILSVVGALGSTTICYILPGYCFWRLRPEGASPTKIILAAALCVTGCIVMPLALTLAIMSAAGAV